MAVRRRLLGEKLNNGSRNRPLDGRDQADAVHMRAVVGCGAVLMLRVVRMRPGLRAAVLMPMVAPRPRVQVRRCCGSGLVMHRAVPHQARRAFHGRA